jgi:hypothetical protein
MKQRMIVSARPSSFTSDFLCGEKKLAIDLQPSTTNILYRKKQRSSHFLPTAFAFSQATSTSLTTKLTEIRLLS